MEIIDNMEREKEILNKELIDLNQEIENKCKINS